MISHGSRSGSRSGTRSRWTSTPGAAARPSPRARRRARRRRSPAATRRGRARRARPRPRSALARERVADLHRRALLVRRPRRAPGDASTLGAADPVAAGRRAEEHEQVARARAPARASRARHGQEPDAHRVDEAVVGVGLVEDGLAADRRHADRVPVRADARDGARRSAWSGAPKRSPSSSATGRAPIAMMSRRIPPTPVAAPWNGSTAEGWLWLSTLNATASPSPRSSTPAFSPGPCSTRSPLEGSRLQEQRRVLVAAVLRPEQREDRELEVVRLAAEQVVDPLDSPSVSPSARWIGCSATVDGGGSYYGRTTTLDSFLTGTRGPPTVSPA